MTRLDRARRQTVLREVPPRKCSARSVRSGEPCKQWAVVGASTCVTHGSAAPQVRAAAERRITLAEALANGDRRSPTAVLADAVHSADVLMRQAVQATREVGEPVPVDLMDALVGSIGRAAGLAKIAADMDIDQSTLNEEAADLVLSAILITADLLKIPLTERRARKALSLGMRSVDEVGGTDAKARRAYLDRESSRLLALMDESEAAAKPPPAHEIRQLHLAELRGRASLGRCPCCDTLPRHRGDGLRAIEAGPAPMDDFDGYDGPAPAQPPDGASEPEVIVATVIDEPPAPRALPRWPLCSMCGGVNDPSHSRMCPYANGSLGGFGGAWGGGR